MRRFRIGRGEGCDIVVRNNTVSRQHAEIEELGAGRFLLRDLGSSSGTWAMQSGGWAEVKETEVRHDSRIRFGEHETTPAALFREIDATNVEARAGAARPAAAARAAPPPRAPQSGATDPKTVLWFAIGGGVFFFAAIIAVILVLALGGAGNRTPSADPEPPKTDQPPRTDQPPKTDQPPRTDQPGEPGAARLLQACTQSWQQERAYCDCIVRTIGPLLQAEDYADFSELLGELLNNNGDRARQLYQQINSQKGADTANRMYQAIEAIERECR